MVGIYGGPTREYNPGCFMIGYKTYYALKKRIPSADIHLYSIDSFGRYNGIQVEEEGGIELRFVSSLHQIELLENELSSYDALILGGDNLWDFGRSSHWPFLSTISRLLRRNPSIFLLDSKSFLNSQTPIVATNCINSLMSRKQLIRNRHRFIKVCRRSAFITVRSQHLKNVLHQDFGIGDVSVCYDPVLGLDPRMLPKPSQCIDLPPSDKPKLGIAIRPSFLWSLTEVLKTLQDVFEQYDVWFFPFSRFHNHHEAHLKIRKIFGSKFNYWYLPLNPIDAFLFMGNFDVVFNDTYHGTIGAIIQQKPFLTVRFREAPLSRRSELFASLGIEDRSIRILDPLSTNGHAENTRTLERELPSLLDNPQYVTTNTLIKARAEIEQYFDHLAKSIIIC